MKLRIEYRAAMKAERLGVPFALVLLPGKKTPQFFVADPTKDSEVSLLNGADFDSFQGFVFNFFELSDKVNAYGIEYGLTAQQFMDMDESAIPNQPACSVPNNDQTTNPIVYKAQALSIINGFENDQQKTVLSHIVKMHTSSNPIDVCIAYFKKHPDCFRYIYYTPQSGIWIGASPELLLDYRSDSNTVRSMSLAGTTKADDNNAWDIKNTLEHNMVTEHILKVLKNAGLKDISTDQSDLRFGKIRHLCHHILAHGSIQPSALLPELSPTPALCGWPRERAYKEIVETESHIRGCYGGFVGVKTYQQTLIYVNLRCAKVMPTYIKEINTRLYDFTLYGGGGLTIYSDPDKEWFEAKSKINSLLSIL